MFPLTPVHILHELTRDPYRSNPREPVPASRLDIQRRHLEDKHMYELNAMIIDQVRESRDRTLALRQQIALAQGDRLSATARIRHALGNLLVSAGERIRPELERVPEPRLNV